MACDEEGLQLQKPIESVSDNRNYGKLTTASDIGFFTCTCARNHLMISGLEPGSEFLGDMTQIYQAYVMCGDQSVITSVPGTVDRARFATWA